MASIFTRIVRGEIPCYKIAETEHYLAFLDIRPLVKGHTLVIPKEEIDYLFDLPDDLYIGLHLFAKSVAQAIERVVPCTRIGTLVVGDEVPHAHIHLVPFQTFRDMSFVNKRISMTSEEMAALAAEIRSKLIA